jgi:hypothetical protein
MELILDPCSRPARLEDWQKSFSEQRPHGAMSRKTPITPLKVGASQMWKTLW